MNSYPVRLFVGNIQALPVSGRPTGIYKSPITGPSEIGLEGFTNDHQADRRVHGGRDKAIHQFPVEHYKRLAEKFPDAAHLLVPGSIGENISSTLTEAEVRFGDVWRLGSALLQVCQPRKPCWKIDERFEADGMAAFIDEHGLTGWYWRVIQTGSVTPDDRLFLEKPASHGIALKTAMELCAEHRPDTKQLRAIAELEGIADNWVAKINQRIKWLEEN